MPYIEVSRAGFLRTLGLRAAARRSGEIDFTHGEQIYSLTSLTLVEWTVNMQAIYSDSV